MNSSGVDRGESIDQDGDFLVRQEMPPDRAAAERVVEAAFGSPAVAALVRSLRESADYVPELSLVAEQDGEIVGYTVLTYASLQDGRRVHRVLNLSPLAVARSAQGRGCGSSLVTEALARAEGRHEPMILLEGSHEYYGRFGFKDARQYGIVFALPQWAPPNAGQVRTLRHYDAAIKGRLRYPPAFAAMEAARQAERSGA